MKGINSTDDKIKDFGWKEIERVDKSPSYEIDEAILFNKDKKYALVSAVDCSCWSGNYEGWIDMNKKELLKIAKEWAKENSGEGDAAKELGKIISEKYK
jgi:hypothetical protein